MVIYKEAWTPWEVMQFVPILHRPALKLHALSQGKKDEKKPRSSDIKEHVAQSSKEPCSSVQRSHVAQSSNEPRSSEFEGAM